MESELQPGFFRDVFRVIPDPPPEECTPQRLVLKIESRADLWRVLMLHPGAFVEIPELEFEIGADHRRRVDSVYNHIAASVFNLERHVEMLGEDNVAAVRLSPGERGRDCGDDNDTLSARIYRTVSTRRACLERPHLVLDLFSVASPLNFWFFVCLTSCLGASAPTLTWRGG